VRRVWKLWHANEREKSEESGRCSAISRRSSRGMLVSVCIGMGFRVADGQRVGIWDAKMEVSG
jgi:hypothetical protein